MAAIDEMLSQLEDMGFSAQEINIFLNLKLRERSREEAKVKIAVVECNPENLSYISEQFRHVSGVDLYSFMLDSVEKYPYKLAEGFDLVVATSSHAEFIESVLPRDKRVTRIALRPSQSFLSQIIRLSPKKKVGIIAESARFAGLVYNTCRNFTEDVEIFSPLSSGDGKIKEYISSVDTLVLPKHYERHLDRETLSFLREFDGDVIECYYEMDEGSLLYLETKVNRILSDKKL